MKNFVEFPMTYMDHLFGILECTMNSDRDILVFISKYL